MAESTHFTFCYQDVSWQVICIKFYFDESDQSFYKFIYVDFLEKV